MAEIPTILESQSPEKLAKSLSWNLMKARQARRDVVKLINEFREGKIMEASSEEEKRWAAQILSRATDLASSLQNMFFVLIENFPAVTSPETSQAVGDAEEDLTKMMKRVYEIGEKSSNREESFLGELDELLHHIDQGIHQFNSEVSHLDEPFTRPVGSGITHIEHLVTEANKAMQVSRVLVETIKDFFGSRLTIH